VLGIASPDLTVAVFDRPGHRGRNVRDTIDADYLRRRRRRQAARQLSKEGSLSSNAELVPFYRVLERRRAVSLVARAEIEADDVIGATCATLCEEPGVIITIASADADMQRFLRPNVSWLQLLPLPTATHPTGFSIVRDHDFERTQGFPPYVYADWLAMVGKKEASIGGVGIGPMAASKLLARFGSIDAILSAAAQGQLKGWKQEIQNAFQPETRMYERLLRNRSLFAGTAGELTTLVAPAQDVLEAAVKGAISKCKQSEAPDKQIATVMSHDDVAWLHPVHQGRWRHAAPHARQLADLVKGMGVACTVRSVSPGGVPVDVMVNGRAILICCDCDFDQRAMNHTAHDSLNTDQLMAVLTGNDAAPSIAGKLNSVVKQHVSWLRKEGLRPICVPWHWIPN
jgi:hypothetical protein